jgi:chemotaxis family two-component system sensor kinase Cph1
MPSCAPFPTIRCDEASVRKALRALVDNAIRYIGSGEDKRIELGWSASGTHYLVWVRDNGIGIAPEAQEGVFHLFRRGKHEPYREGRKGVGLSVVKAVAESHGGVAWVESKLGEGSTFCFSLAKERVRNLLKGDAEDLPSQSTKGYTPLRDRRADG